MPYNTCTFEYEFNFADGRHKTFQVVLEEQTLEQQNRAPGPYPAWTRLDFHQCSNCPLRTTSHTSCPLALTLLSVVEFFKDMASYEQVEVTVTVPERKITCHTTVQRALSSLMGLLMPTSGCPRMALFKPMARFHLPFSSEEETIYRVSSMYLLAQYFLRTDEKDVDFDLVGLIDYYRQVETVNKALSQRLFEASVNDASVNAVILLDLFAKALPDAIDDSLDELRHLFGAFQQEDAGFSVGSPNDQ